MADLVFYTHPQSRGQTICWMLEEVGAPYETEVLDYASTMKAEPYLSVNPMGKAPAIVHKGKVVTEVRGDLLLPRRRVPRSKARAAAQRPRRLLSLDFFTSGPVEAAFSNKAAGWEPTPERQRMFGYGNYDLAINTLEKALSGRRISRREPFHRRPICSSAPTSISCSRSTSWSRGRCSSITPVE